MKYKIIMLISLLFCFSYIYSQNYSDEQLEMREKMRKRLQKEYNDSLETERLRKRFGLEKIKKYKDGSFAYLSRFDLGIPVYLITNSLNCAKTIETNKIQASSGISNSYNLTGTGEYIGMWELSVPYPESYQHYAYRGRIIINDNSLPINADYALHASAVASVLISNYIGENNKYRGMAPSAYIYAYNADNILSEMQSASSTVLCANLSYGEDLGWNKDGIWTMVDRWASETKDYRFGFYGNSAQSLDESTNDSPYLTIVQSAGNSKGLQENNAHEPNGGINGYDCLAQQACAKNIITIGNIDDLPNGSSLNASNATLASNSSTGPTKDGRIKPDLVANGVGVSVIGTTETQTLYGTLSGTSFSTPSVTGSIALLNQLIKEKLGNNVKFRSSTMKALLIHTAEDAGNIGPDYKFGWGVPNFNKAAQMISNRANASVCNTIREYELSQGEIIRVPIIVQGGNVPLKVTVCWNDPAGMSIYSSGNDFANVYWGNDYNAVLNYDERTLVNDLDLRVKTNAGIVYYPYILNKANPSALATTGDNSIDNIEQVYIGNLSEKLCYIEISHKGTLKNEASQIVSLIVSGEDTEYTNRTILNDVYASGGSSVVGYQASSDLIFNNCKYYNSNLLYAVAGNSITIISESIIQKGTLIIDSCISCQSMSTLRSTGSYPGLILQWKDIPDNLYENIEIDKKDDSNNIYFIENDLNIIIAPNPTSGECIIEWKEELPIVKILIMDVFGKKLQEYQVAGSRINLNLTTYVKGIYFVQIITDKKIITKQLIIE